MIQHQEQVRVLFTFHGLLIYKLMKGEILESISVKWKVSDNVKNVQKCVKSIVFNMLADVVTEKMQSDQCGDASKKKMMCFCRSCIKVIAVN